MGGIGGLRDGLAARFDARSEATDFAEFLRSLRIEAGLTQEALAERAGMSARGIQELERGNSRPRRETLTRLASALELSGEQRRTLVNFARTWPRGRGIAVLPSPSRRQRTNLPRQLSSFVGRDAALGELDAQLQRTRLLSLVGPGGVGKTRLALALAERHLPEYAGGIWLAPLDAVLNSELLLSTVTNDLPVAQLPGQSLLDALTRVLNVPETLLVLDNCEHIIAACAELVVVLLQSCPDLTIVVTSREPLRVPGEVVWLVEPLGLPDFGRLDHPGMESEAVRLFIERANAVRAAAPLGTDAMEDVVRICQRVGGLPLAIELAAACTRAFSVGQVAASLEGSLSILSHGDRTAPRRHRTLRNTLDWSYALLDASLQRLFDRLSVFVGPFTLDEAQSVCVYADKNDALVNVVDAIITLTDKSFLHVEQGSEPGLYYRLLEPLREYAEGHLRASDEYEALREEHARYFLKIVRDTNPSHSIAVKTAWLDRIERARPNVAQALEWCVQAGQVERGLEVAVNLVGFWQRRGYLSEGRLWLERLLDCAVPGSEDSPARATASMIAGYLAQLQADYAVSAELYLRAQSMFDSQGDRTREADALHNMANVLQLQGDLSGARVLFERVLQTRRELGDRRGEALTLNTLGEVALRQARLDEAEELSGQSLRLWLELGDEEGCTFARGNLGEVARQRGDYSRADAFYMTNLSVQRGLASSRGIAISLNALADVARNTGDLALASERFRESLRRCHTIGEVWILADDLQGLALVAAEQAARARAVRLYAAADQLLTSVGAAPWPVLFEVHQQQKRRLREQLGSKAFHEQWDKGRRLALDDVVAYAMEDSDPVEGSEPQSRTTELRDLSERELEVLALVARGLTNRQIAGQLVLSDRTVHHHLENILSKLGVTSRTAAAVVAQRNGIVD